MSQLPEHYDDIHNGWHVILQDLHADLSKLDPAYRVVQVKEKFGGLRVHLDSYGNELIWSAIERAEKRALATCEFCGEPGHPRRPKGRPEGWIKTVCEVHWA